MEDLVSRIKNVNLTEIDANNRYIRSFISGIVNQDFRRRMIENYKLGLDHITFLKYNSTDVIVFGLFHRWEIVSFGNSTTIMPGVCTFVLKDLVTSPSFWDILQETFPDFFLGLTNQGNTYYINIYWDK
jgi:hypothetical protein